MAKKRKLGHVTEEESKKVRSALISAKAVCLRKYKTSDPRFHACALGVEAVQDRLDEAGFGVPYVPFPYTRS